MVIRIVFMYTGDKPDVSNVTQLVLLLLQMNVLFPLLYKNSLIQLELSELTNKSESFSVLTKADKLKIVPKGYGGKIYFSPSRVRTKVPDQFSFALDVLHRTLSRELEAGCRPIIAYISLHLR